MIAVLKLLKGALVPETSSSVKFQRLLTQIVSDYDADIRTSTQRAETTVEQTGRALGGVLRSAKGNLLERITEKLIYAALLCLKGVSEQRIEINSKKVRIYARENYLPRGASPTTPVSTPPRRVFFYNAGVDRHIWIDGRLVCGIECKAYTENAMLKRILVDFQLLQTVHPRIVPMLFQLESMLGGDFHCGEWPCAGSPSTHTLLSHFPDVSLHIVTLLKGERSVKLPLHRFYKPLTVAALESAAYRFAEAVHEQL